MMRFMIYFVLCIIAKELVPNFAIGKMLAIGMVVWFVSTIYHGWLEEITNGTD